MAAPDDKRSHWIESTHHLLITADRLRIGMFIVELDRSWLDTPFPLQGLLLQTEQEIQRVAQYCRFVYIDPQRCTSEITVELLAEQKARARLRKPLAPEQISAEILKPGERGFVDRRTSQIMREALQQEHPTERFERFERLKAALQAPDYSQSSSLLRRVFSNFFGAGEKDGRSAALPRENVAQIRKTLNLPPQIPLTTYRDQKPVRRELSTARAVYVQTQRILDTLLTDAQQGVTVPLSSVNEAMSDMVDSVIRNPDALLWLSRIRKQNTHTYAHSIRVAVYMMALGRYIGFPREQLSHLGTIGLLLDVGKLKIPRELLEKPAALTEDEFAIVKNHVFLGLQQLEAGKPLAEEIEQGIAQHHERENGGGYPCALAGDQISIYGRMAAIADTFAAMTSERPYARALSAEDAMLSLYQWSGSHFHAPLVEKFVQAIGLYPSGSLVELNTGEVAAVLAHNKVRRMQPRVLLLTDTQKKPLSRPAEIDLLRQEMSDSRGAKEGAKEGTKGEGKIARSIARGLPSGSYSLNLRDYYLDPTGLPETVSGTE